ncbi:RNA polymerase sigma factor [Candidatus Zixiibacteriota bacterium]
MIDQAAKNLNALFRLAAHGDQRAEHELFVNLGARFRVFVKRRLWAQDDWEDVVQDALATVSLKYKEVEPVERFTGWAYQVLKNKLMNYIQSKSRRGEIVVRMPEYADPMALDDTEQAVKRQLLKCLKQIWQVNVRYARILNLHYQGYSTAEVCRRLALRSEVYYSVLARARNKLRQCLEQGGVGT